MIECTDCNGSGEICWEPMDWWHGSGVNVQSSACPSCSGTGSTEPEPTDDDEPDEMTDETVSDDQKHADLQSLIDSHCATVETFGLVLA